MKRVWVFIQVEKFETKTKCLQWLLPTTLVPKFAESAASTLENIFFCVNICSLNKLLKFLFVCSSLKYLHGNQLTLSDMQISNNETLRKLLCASSVLCFYDFFDFQQHCDYLKFTSRNSRGRLKTSYHVNMLCNHLEESYHLMKLPIWPLK